MVRDRAGRLQRRMGLSLGPIVVFLAVALVAGAGLFTWDYLWRQQQEVARRPAPPEVIARNLVENIIGRNTVKASQVDAGTGVAAVTFESATFKPEPEQSKQHSREFLTAEAELASQAILAQLEQVRRVNLTIVDPKSGATLATATAVRGRPVQMTYVDPRLR